jgi:low temperature requirement protein LtrA
MFRGRKENHRTPRFATDLTVRSSVPQGASESTPVGSEALTRIDDQVGLADEASDGERIDRAKPEKRVSSAELFFDLVFVFAVTQVSSLLESDHSGSELLRALIVFIPVYWMWVGAAVQTNLLDTGRPSLRLSLFAIALASIFMAIAIPDAYTSEGLLFAIAYWVGRIIVGTLMLGRWPRNLAGWLTPYTVSILITGPLLVIGAVTAGMPRVAIWAFAAAIDLAAPTLLQSKLRDVHYDAAHLAERFGAFVLIALGESVVAIGASAQADHRLHLGGTFAVAFAFGLAAGLWWVYFHFAADAIRHGLATARIQANVTRLVLSYGHLLFIAAIVMLSVGMYAAVAEPARHLSWSNTGLLFGGTALYLVSFGFWRWTMFRQVAGTRLVAAVVVVLASLLAPHVPAVIDLIVLASILAVLNGGELITIKLGRPLW